MKRLATGSALALGGWFVLGGVAAAECSRPFLLDARACGLAADGLFVPLAAALFALVAMGFIGFFGGGGWPSPDGAPPEGWRRASVPPDPGRPAGQRLAAELLARSAVFPAGSASGRILDGYQHAILAVEPGGRITDLAGREIRALPAELPVQRFTDGLGREIEYLRSGQPMQRVETVAGPALAWVDDLPRATTLPAIEAAPALDAEPAAARD